jgi:hypothetical protein
VRQIVATTWRGPRLVRSLGLSAAQQHARVAAMTDDQIASSLAKLAREGVLADTPDTAQERRDRLVAFPTTADLDAIADALVQDGVRPQVRVVTKFPTLRFNGVSGPAGTAG